MPLGVEAREYVDIRLGVSISPMCCPLLGPSVNHRQTWKSTSSLEEESPKAAVSGIDSKNPMSVIVCLPQFVYDADKAVS